MLSHDEAQELHRLIGFPLEAAGPDGDCMVSRSALERARELAALLVHDTMGDRVPDPSPVSYAPCITGKVDVGGQVSEFMLPLLNDSVQYSQWGADNTVLWPRVDLMEALAEAAGNWAYDNICRTCKENMLDDGEGYNGECGDCADVNPDNHDEENNDD